MKLGDLSAALDGLRKASRLREPDDSLERRRMESAFADDFIDAASNDYLGLGARRSPLVSRETEPPSFGASASRLVHGTALEHLEVERFTREWLGYEAALLFSSGYAANVGALGALLSPDDAVFSDVLNHASLIDGIRLAKVRPVIYGHLNLGELELKLQAAASAPARWVVTESYYSMDGDGPNLSSLRGLCDRYDAALYVDEAHSIGTFGPKGKGLCALSGLHADVLVAAFGKAVGADGACVLGSQELRTWLWNRARSFSFSTAPSPLRSQALLSQLQAAEAADSQREELAQTCAEIRARLAYLKVPLVGNSFGPILSLIVGAETKALELATAFKGAGILAQAIRPPTVAEGESRVRLVLHAGLGSRQREHLAQTVARETSRLLEWTGG